MKSDKYSKGIKADFVRDSKGAAYDYTVSNLEVQGFKKKQVITWSK